MKALIWCSLFIVILQQVNGSPWVFEEIKPISASESVKKSSVPEKPVQEIDPSKTLVHIKEDIRSDILGNNGTTFKYKEGVKKLLDFLGSGSANDDKLKNKNNDTTTQDDQHKQDHQADDGVAKILLQFDKGHTNDQIPSNVNASQVKQPKLLSNTVSSLVSNDGLVTKTTQSYQPKLPVAVRSQTPLVSSTNTAQIPSLQQQQNVFTKNKMPYFGIKNDVAMAAQLARQKVLRKSYIPYSSVPKYQPYHPYMAYKKSSLPYGWYNTNSNIATQQQQVSPHYPYQQISPLIMRSKVPNLLYRNPYSTYTKSYIPKPNPSLYRLPTFKKAAQLSKPPALMRFSTINNARAPIFQHAQIAHVPLYRQPMQWNSVPHGLEYGRPRYRRMAVTNRGRKYDGLQSPREKVAQKTPLPLPLASIMTAARIVVPARPNTLNGASKSNVETIQPDNAEQPNARAV